MKSPEEVKSEFVREWLSKVNADLLASRHLLKEESKLAFVSAFHAQQAVEKALKALLVWHQIEFPKTHDIRQLLDLLTSPEPELSKELDEASSLTDYAIEHRYPADNRRANRIAGKGSD
jgi:HEPN domain-containing protein